MNDDHLDDLFSRARTLTPSDLGAAERALPNLRAATAKRHRTTLRAWTSALLASAAMLGAVVYVQQHAALPTSAAYDTYNSVAGSDW